MNRAVFKGNLSPDINGRTLLIVIIVLSSSLSFTLGFLVGKYAKEKTPDTISAKSDPAPVQSAQQARETASPASPDKTAPPDTSTKTAEPVVADAQKIPGQKTVDAASRKAEEKTAVPVPAEQRETEGRKKASAVYTVQLGAMKNRDEAENLKSKYEKKGYKLFITVWTGKKREKIYKIRSGEFSDRKDAEILALKFKKNEGLTPFVTFID